MLLSVGPATTEQGGYACPRAPARTDSEPQAWAREVQGLASLGTLLSSLSGFSCHAVWCSRVDVPRLRVKITHVALEINELIFPFSFLNAVVTGLLCRSTSAA